MYAKNTKNYVNFFHTNGVVEDSEKVAYGRVSESFRRNGADGQPLLQDGKHVYEYETWNARFVGKAKHKFDLSPLKDKDSIILTEWAAHVQYNKELKQSYPYLLIMDYEVNEK